MLSVSKFTVLFAVAIATTIPAFAAPAFQDKGEAKAWITPPTGDMSEALNIVETRYFEMGYPNENLLKAVIATTRFQGAEGLAGQTDLTMFGSGTGRLDKVLWTAKVQGSGVNVLNEDLVGVVEYGCCGSLDTTRLFNAVTGQKVEAAMGDIYEIEVPNSYHLGKRYLSIAIDSKAAPTVGGKTYIGTFSYFTKNKIVSRVRVYADLPSGWGTDFSEMKVIGLAPSSKLEAHRSTKITLWDTDGVKDAAAAFSGFALESKLSYDKQEETVRVTIKGDKIDATLSTGTKGLHLEVLN